MQLDCFSGQGVEFKLSGPLYHMTCCSGLARHPLTSLPRFPFSSTKSFRSSRSSDIRFLRSSRKDLRWRSNRLSCLRHEETELSNSEILESLEFNEELEDSDSNRLDADNDNWITPFQKVKRTFFTLQSEPWTVPWTTQTIIQVMLLWICSFWIVGSWIIPFLAHVFNFSKHSLTYRGQALYSLVTDIAAGLAGVTILHRCLSKFRPLPTGWFHFSLKGTWYFDVLLACLLFPLVNILTQINMNMVHALPSPTIAVSSVEQSILARDPIAMVLYALVVLVCAPIWEEILFRGFILPSLTRYMPLWWSILLSAMAFAFTHFNVQRLLPLVLLGVMKGVVFAKSKNLLAPMFLHSLWNGYVFLDLMK